MATADDADDVLAELAGTVDGLAALTARRDALVARARAAGATWAELAAVLGVTVQAAHKRYRTTRCDPDTGRTWREPPLPMGPRRAASRVLSHRARMLLTYPEVLTEVQRRPGQPLRVTHTPTKRNASHVSVEFTGTWDDETDERFEAAFTT